MPSINHNTIPPMHEKFPAMFDVFGDMFDVIVKEVKKYGANAGKPEAKIDKQFERLDVIAIAQIKTKNYTVKQASRFNLQR